MPTAADHCHTQSTVTKNVGGFGFDRPTAAERTKERFSNIISNEEEEEEDGSAGSV